MIKSKKVLNLYPVFYMVTLIYLKVFNTYIFSQKKIVVAKCAAFNFHKFLME
jgi:hypothetical protein